MDKEFELAKKIARTKIAGEIKHTRTLSSDELKREFIEGFVFKDKGLSGVANTYKSLAEAFYHMVRASNFFNSLRSSEISPDGKIGGKGYIQEIKQVRTELSNGINSLSGLIDTFYDEVSSPYWKKTVIEDHPIVKEILEESDEIIDRAENYSHKVEQKEKNVEKEDIKEQAEQIPGLETETKTL